MTPQIGDEVIVRYETRPDRAVVNGQTFVTQGASPVIETAVGTLGVEMADYRVVGLVIETDGGATFVSRSSVVSVEVIQ